jgi:PGF-CTERM protein
VRSNGTVDGPYIVPYVSGVGGETVVSGPALGTGLVAVNESPPEVQATVVAEDDAGLARTARAPTSVVAQENTEVRSSSKTSNSGASEGSGPGFGVLGAIIAIFSGFILARRV